MIVTHIKKDKNEEGEEFVLARLKGPEVPSGLTAISGPGGWEIRHGEITTVPNGVRHDDICIETPFGCYTIDLVSFPKDGMSYFGSSKQMQIPAPEEYKVGEELHLIAHISPFIILKSTGEFRYKNDTKPIRFDTLISVITSAARRTIARPQFSIKIEPWIIQKTQ